MYLMQRVSLQQGTQLAISLLCFPSTLFLPVTFQSNYYYVFWKDSVLCTVEGHEIKHSWFLLSNSLRICQSSK